MLADKTSTPGPDMQQTPESDLQSTVESYKRRSNSYFGNPLMPPKELFVPVPDKERLTPHRTPFYQTQTDLIVNGVGENQRGVPRHTVKEKLLGHNSVDMKAQILGGYTRDNLNSLANRLEREEIERQKDLIKENEQNRRDTYDFFLN